MAHDIAKDKLRHPSSVSLIEDAFHVLRKLPVEGCMPYFTGTLPFILGLLYFWNDMSQNAFAHEYCLRASCGLTVLFIWMKGWQSVFSTRLYDHLSRRKHGSLSVKSCIKLFVNQTIVQTSSFAILPVAAAIALPFAWTFAMYQMALVRRSSGDGTPVQILRENYLIATRFTLLNHAVPALLFLFSCFVFFNIGIAVYILPFFAKSLFGVDSAWTMGGFNPLNSTFIITIACLTHICIDPVIKTVFVLEKFLYQSQKTGDSLTAGLEKIKTVSKKTMLGMALVSIPILFSASGTGYAGTPGSHALPTGTPAIDAVELEKNIGNVIQQREFAWRLPRPATDQDIDSDGFFYKIATWIIRLVKDNAETIKSWLERFFGWIGKLFPQKSDIEDPEPAESLIKPAHLVAVLIVLVTCLLFFIVRHIRKKRSKQENRSEEQEDMTIDVSDDHVLADKLPSEKWVALAFELMEKKAFRTAVRALYLGTLALLSEKNFISIARYKSNRDYVRELIRRAHSKPQMREDFIASVKTVDRVWYGMHTADRQVFDTFARYQKRIFQHAE